MVVKMSYLLSFESYLLSFDCHNEVFGKYTLPDFKQYEKKSHVFSFEGSISMIIESVNERSILS